MKESKILRNLDLRFNRLKNLDLRGADFTGSWLNGNDLSGMDLTGANFTGADLTMCNMEGAILEGAIYDAEFVYKENSKNRYHPVPYVKANDAFTWLGSNYSNEEFTKMWDRIPSFAIQPDKNRIDFYPIKDELFFNWGGDEAVNAFKENVAIYNRKGILPYHTAEFKGERKKYI